MTPITMLVLASNPLLTDRLTIDAEVRAITERVQLSSGRDRLRIETAWAVRRADLLHHLNLHMPEIVHFSGHGTEAGEIILEGDDGGEAAVSADALTAIFKTFKDRVRLVVLNACYSRMQGAAINRNIDFVIGMNTEVGDESAITFAAALYQAIGFGRSVRDAFEQAVASLILHETGEHETPELLVRDGADAMTCLLDLAEEAPPPRTGTITVHGGVRGANVVIGGQQTIIGDHVHIDKDRGE